jgi:hypothetical protein
MDRLRRTIVILLATAMLLAVPALAQRHTKRLILKDGSYQETEQWEVKGDRVRYFSSEREDWEEVPNALIDWDATNKWNSASANSRTPYLQTPEGKKAQAQYEAAMKQEEASRPEVAKGIRLPEDGGVWMIDYWQDQPELVEMVQSGSEVNRHTGKNILRAAIDPLPTGQKQTIDIKGVKARIQAHVPQPEIYVNIDPAANDDSSGAAKHEDLDTTSRYKIVRLTPGKDRRTVSNLNISIFGHESEKQNVIDTVATKVNDGDWVKIVPRQPLTPGEYALIEMLGPKQMNSFVWDFGVNPSAPKNPERWNAPKPIDSTGMDDIPAAHTKIKKGKKK